MKKYKFNIPFNTIHIVWWLDAYVSQEPNFELEKETDNLTISIGVKIKEDDEFVHLSHFYDGISNDLLDPITSIPKGMIKKTIKIDTKNFKKEKV